MNPWGWSAVAFVGGFYVGARVMVWWKLTALTDAIRDFHELKRSLEPGPKERHLRSVKGEGNGSAP